MVAAKKVARAVSDHPMAHMIPPIEFHTGYINRTIHGIRDMDLLRYAQEVNKHVLLAGDTGPGKTAMVMAYAAQYGIPLVTIACNGGIDPNSFWGGYVPDQVTGGLRWQDSDALGVVIHGGILYVDEPNFMPPKTAASFHPLLDARRFVTVMEQGNRQHVAHKSFICFGSYNPDYEGTRPLNKAFKNRFKIKLHIDYSREVESKLVCMPVMLEMADKLRQARKSGDLETPVSTNMLVEFEELAVDLGLVFALENFVGAFESEERDAVRSIIELHHHDLGVQLEQMMAD